MGGTSALPSGLYGLQMEIPQSWAMAMMAALQYSMSYLLHSGTTGGAVIYVLCNPYHDRSYLGEIRRPRIAWYVHIAVYQPMLW